MGGWCEERYDKDENNKLEGLHQKPDQMEETHWEGQNFSEVVAPQEEEEEEAKYEHPFLCTFQIVGYLYVTLFIYCLPCICSLTIVLYI